MTDTHDTINEHSNLSPYARHVIETLGLEQHPEGGWYRRDWQADGTDQDGRPLASLIYFLLPAGDYSAWHRVDADEIWLWHGPGQVILEESDSPDASAARQIHLGQGLRPAAGSADGIQQIIGHHVIAAHTWQRTVPGDEDALVSCVVSPGFQFSGFELNAEHQQNV